MLEVIPVLSRRQKSQFVELPYSLYRNHPYWVPHLKIERHDMFNANKNPFFENADVQLFLVKEDNKILGRISAHINHLHNKIYQETTGHFGFFESVDRQDVANALFLAAQKWLQERGMTKIVGPLSFSTNEETGLLIKGFDSSPYPFMAYNFPYYQSLIENFGFAKTKDLIAWDYDATRPVPEGAAQIADYVKTYPGLVVREIKINDLENEIKLISEVFNSAWSKNWGFIPWTESEIKKTAKDLKLIIEPKLALIAEVNGQPAAISLAFPNYHEAIKDLKGSLFPFGIFKFLYRLKTKKIKTSRLALLGVKREYRNDILAGLSVLLYTEMHKRGAALGQKGGELSWTLEDNEKINNGISLMGGVPYKTYRVFEKSLS